MPLYQKKLSIQNSFPKILWYPIVGSKSSELACVAKTLKFYFFFNTFWLFDIQITSSQKKSSGLHDVDFLAKQKTHQLQILIQIILHV